MATDLPDLSWLFFKMIAGLIIVLGLAIVFTRFVLPRTRRARMAETAWGRLIDFVRLDQNHYLYLVKIAGRFFVLGATQNSLNVVTELSAQEGEEASQKGGKS